MGENSALLQAVCAEPDNDEPRLVYADWLEEHGDLTRAEHLRLQLKLASPPTKRVAWNKLNKRRLKLEAAHMETWIAQLPTPKGITWYPDFRRGFPAGVEVENLTVFRAHAATLFRTSPIQCVRFTRLCGTKRLAAMPELARLTGLFLDRLRLGPEDAENLAASPYLANLRELSLSKNRLGDAGVIALSRSPYLRQLVKLDLGDNDIWGEGVRALARSPILQAVRYLDLRANEIDDTGAAALVKSPYLQDIDGLSLWEVYGISANGERRLRERFGFKVSFAD